VACEKHGAPCGTYLVYSASELLCTACICVWTTLCSVRGSPLVCLVGEQLLRRASVCGSLARTLGTAFSHDYRDYRGLCKHTDGTAAPHLCCLCRYKEATGGLPERMASGSDDFTMFLWSPSTSKQHVARLTGHVQTVNQVR